MKITIDTLPVRISFAETNQSDRGLIAWRRKGKKQFRVSSERVAVADSLAVAQDGKIWAAQRTGSTRAFTCFADEIQFTPPELAVGLSKSILVDRDGTLWISTLGDGLQRVRYPAALGPEKIEPQNEAMDRFTESNGLCNDHVNCLFEDREGNIWVGSQSGVDCFSETKITNFSIREGLPFDDSLMLEATSDGSLWAARRNGGLFQIIPAGHSSPNARWAKLNTKGSDGIHCLYASPSGGFLASTAIGVKQVDTMDWAFKGASAFSNVVAMTRDSAGNLWLSDEDRGLVRVIGDVATPIERKQPLAPGDYACAAHTDKSGCTWFGYRYGTVDCWSNGTFLHYSQTNGLNIAEIRGFLSDAQGQVWVVGKEGIGRFRDGRFQTLRVANDVSAMLQDDDRFFWVAEPAQLVRVAPAEIEKGLSAPGSPISYQTFGFADGLKGYIRQPYLTHPGDGFPLAAKTMDGRLWFSTSGGLAVIDPHHIGKNPIAPPVHIERLIASGKTNLTFEDLRFASGTKDFELDYAGLCFADPYKVLYKYRLDGHDRDWVEAGSRRQAFYSNLRPKRYTFHVRACNNDGVWSETDAVITFAIVPAFYETAWFPVLCLMPVVLVVWGFHRLRLASVSARMNLLLEAQLKERKRIAQELHDTLLQGFTGIGLKLDALANALPPSLAATKEQLQKILERSDEYLVEARRAVWELRSPSLEKLADFSQALKKVSERALQGTGTELEIATSGVACKLLPEIEDNLLRMCEEAVTNAVKHGCPTRVNVALEYTSDEIRLRVRDNGCGFDPQGSAGRKEGHFGLVGINERVKSLGGKLSLNSQPGQGTELLISIRLCE